MTRIRGFSPRPGDGRTSLVPEKSPQTSFNCLCPLELPVSTTLTNKLAPLFAAVALACTGAAHAQSLLDGSTYASLVGSSAAAVNGVSFAAGGGNFDTKFVNGWGGLGVTGGASGSEIDVGQ